MSESAKIQTASCQESPELPDGFLKDQSLQLRAAMAHAIRQSGLKRWFIAGQMSALTGRELSPFMLDKYTAESAPDHRPHADEIAAFCLTTRSVAPLEVINRPVGHLVVPRLPRLEGCGLSSCDALQQDVAAIMKEVGEVAAVVLRIAKDKKVTAVERAEAMREMLDVAQRAVEACARQEIFLPSV